VAPAGSGDLALGIPDGTFAIRVVDLANGSVAETGEVANAHEIVTFGRRTSRPIALWFVRQR
jgi:hypothetical protein